MRWIWLRFRPCQCMQPDKRLVRRLGWLQSDVLAAEPIVRSALIRLTNEVVMATRPTPNCVVWAVRREKLERVFWTKYWLRVMAVFLFFSTFPTFKKYQPLFHHYTWPLTSWFKVDLKFKCSLVENTAYLSLLFVLTYVLPWSKLYLPKRCFYII